jgi:hypothetical protein
VVVGVETGCLLGTTTGTLNGVDIGHVDGGLLDMLQRPDSMNS